MDRDWSGCMVEVVYGRVEVGSCMVVWRSGRVWSFGCRVVYGREQSSSTGLSNLVGEYGWSDLICSGYLLYTMLTVQCSRWFIVYLWVTHYASINDMCSMSNWASLMIPLAVYWPGVYCLPMTVFTYSTVYPWLCSHTALFLAHFLYFF